MSKGQELVVSGSRELKDQSLDELAATVRRENELAVQALSSAVAHAIAAGEALLEAKPRVPAGRWEKWIVENDLSTQTASRYMRVAHYREHTIGCGSQSEAIRAISGLPALSGRLPGNNGYPGWMIDDARDLKEQGLTYRAVSEQLGVSHATVRRWVDPEGTRLQQRVRKRKARVRKREVREAKRERALKAALAKDDSGVSDALSKVRIAAQSVDAAARAQPIGERSRHANAAYAYIVKAEDELKRVVGIT